MASFEAKDAVAIGDVALYELEPRLDALFGAFALSQLAVAAKGPSYVLETTGLTAAVVSSRTGDLVTTLTVATIDTAGDSDLFESLVGTVAERQAG